MPSGTSALTLAEVSSKDAMSPVSVTCVATSFPETSFGPAPPSPPPPAPPPPVELEEDEAVALAELEVLEALDSDELALDDEAADPTQASPSAHCVTSEEQAAAASKANPALKPRKR